MRITLDYSVNAVVEVDTETGEVLRVAVNAEDFPAVNEAEQVFNADFGENDLDEYLDDTHPEAVKALAIAQRVEVEGGYVELGYKLARAS